MVLLGRVSSLYAKLNRLMAVVLYIYVYQKDLICYHLESENFYPGRVLLFTVECLTGESQTTLSDYCSFGPFVFTADKPHIYPHCCLLLLARSSAEEDAPDRGNPGMWGRFSVYQTPSD